MPIVLTEQGPKRAQTLVNGSPSTLPVSSVPFLPGGRSLALTPDGARTVSYAKLYRTQPWIAVGVKRLVEQIARLPIHLYRWTDDAGETRERDRRHDAARLLRKPRPYRTGFHFRWEAALSLYVHGTSVHWKRRPGEAAPPRELWPLDWRLLTPYTAGQDGTGPIIAWEWRGDGVPGLRRGEFIPPQDVVSIAFGDVGSEVGVSCLQQLGVTIRSEYAIQEHTAAMFRNGARPGLAAILHEKVKADQAKRDGYREELMAMHGGGNVGTPAVLGGGLADLKEIKTQSAVEAELISQRKINREEALAVIGLPPPLGGVLDESNYNALSEFHRLLYMTVLGGPLGLVAESIQAQLIDAEPAWEPDDLFDEFHLGEVLKGDTKERMEAYGVAIEHGVLTLNDVRRLENLKPYTDPRADEPLLAANNVKPLSAIGAGDDDATAAANAIKRLLERAKGIAAGGGAGDVVELRGEFEAELQAAGLNGEGELLAGTFAEIATRGGHE